MFVIPALEKQEGNPRPIITITIIILSALIFFFIQKDDDQHYMEAMQYYEESGLVDIELTAYRDYLQTQDNQPAADITADHTEQKRNLIMQMFQDQPFQQLLKKNTIITSTDSVFAEWKKKREEFDNRLGAIISHKYGYSPTRGYDHGLFTCIFLHGGIMHLFGNMVVLWLVGSMLEIVTGAAFYTLCYLCTGICASILFGLIYPASPGPLVGASGAIAGLMGAYSVLFLKRKIRIFYSFGFYFNYAVVPAILLLPIWIVNEIAQLVMYPGSNVAYVAHIGGLVSGAVFGICFLQLKPNCIDRLFAEQEKKEKIEGYLKSGLKHLGELRFKEARKDMAAILQTENDNLQALRHIYAIDKTQPESKAFIQSSNSFLNRLQTINTDQFLEKFEECQKLCKPLKLTDEIVEKALQAYLVKSDYARAANCLSLLLRRNKDFGNASEYLLKIAHGFDREGKTKESQKCLHYLQTRYPQSYQTAAEAELIR